MAQYTIKKWLKEEPIEDILALYRANVSSKKYQQSLSENIVTHIESNLQTYLALDKDKKAIAFISFFFHLPEWSERMSIVLLYVHPDWHSNGIGKALMNTVLSTGKFPVAVMLNEQKNIRYYQQFGFKLKPVEDHQKCMVMRLTIDNYKQYLNKKIA
ncbi:MAG: GNAT family N-acetyltransferase [Cyanobacteria bacterium P01_G01_bin.54]